MVLVSVVAVVPVQLRNGNGASSRRGKCNLIIPIDAMELLTSTMASPIVVVMCSMTGTRLES